jgi:hypothetical protein
MVTVVEACTCHCKTVCLLRLMLSVRLMLSEQISNFMHSS